MGKPAPKMSERDLQYVLKELDAWESGIRGKRLTWAVLEKASGFSRQTLSKKLDIANKYETVKRALATGTRPRPPKSDDFLIDKVDGLEKEIEQYQLLEQKWLERWMRIAYHLRGKGFSIDDFDKPLPPAGRQ